MTAIQPPDFTFANHGTICLLRPVSEYGAAWAREYLTDPETQWLGGAAAVEPRYIQNIIRGIESDGLTVAGVH